MQGRFYISEQGWSRLPEAVVHLSRCFLMLQTWPTASGLVLSVFECQMGETGVGFMLKGMTIDSLISVELGSGNSSLTIPPILLVLGLVAQEPRDETRSCHSCH